VGAGREGAVGVAEVGATDVAAGLATGAEAGAREEGPAIGEERFNKGAWVVNEEAEGRERGLGPAIDIEEGRKEGEVRLRAGLLKGLFKLVREEALRLDKEGLVNEGAEFILVNAGLNERAGLLRPVKEGLRELFSAVREGVELRLVSEGPVPKFMREGLLLRPVRFGVLRLVRDGVAVLRLKLFRAEERFNDDDGVVRESGDARRFGLVFVRSVLEEGERRAAVVAENTALVV